jgi:hypothetical protein
MRAEVHLGRGFVEDEIHSRCRTAYKERKKDCQEADTQRFVHNSLLFIEVSIA